MRLMARIENSRASSNFSHSLTAGSQTIPQAENRVSVKVAGMTIPVRGRHMRLVRMKQDAVDPKRSRAKGQVVA